MDNRKNMKESQRVGEENQNGNNTRRVERKEKRRDEREKKR